MTETRNPFLAGVTPVINAAGKLTALGGSAQRQEVAQAQAGAAQVHVELAQLRQLGGERIAQLCGAEAACITSGAAAGLCISTAAIVSGLNLDIVHNLPATDEPNYILLQSGHNINFGAPVEQMVRLGGGTPWLLGSANLTTEQLLVDTLERENFAAFLYVQSHHCVQTNQIPLARCIEVCHRFDTPVIVDAAAEEDLTRYVNLGADLVLYSGGKAIGGPTSGFIVGKRDLIAACELQFQGIARSMKIGKEAIAGLLAAIERYATQNEKDRVDAWQARIELILRGVGPSTVLQVDERADEAGRNFSRVAVRRKDGGDIRDLVRFLGEGTPVIRTRNHHLDEGYLLIDPRELDESMVHIIIDRLGQYQP